LLLHASRASAVVSKDSIQSTECKYLALFETAHGIQDILKGLADTRQELSQTLLEQKLEIRQRLWHSKWH